MAITLIHTHYITLLTVMQVCDSRATQLCSGPGLGSGPCSRAQNRTEPPNMSYAAPP